MFPASIFFEHLSKDDVALLANVEEHHYLADATIIREVEQPGQVFFSSIALAAGLFSSIGSLKKIIMPSPAKRSNV
jgi:hypothetical protein